MNYKFNLNPLFLYHLLKSLLISPNAMNHSGARSRVSPFKFNIFYGLPSLWIGLHSWQDDYHDLIPSVPRRKISRRYSD